MGLSVVGVLAFRQLTPPVIDILLLQSDENATFMLHSLENTRNILVKLKCMRTTPSLFVENDDLHSRKHELVDGLCVLVRVKATRLTIAQNILHFAQLRY